MGADTHRADVALLLLLRQVLKGLLVAAQGVEALLLMEHEQVDVVPAHAGEGPFQRRLGRGAVPDIGLGADHVVRRVLQRQLDVRIGAVQVGGVQEAQAALVGVHQQLRAVPGRHVPLQGRHGQRAEAHF